MKNLLHIILPIVLAGGCYSLADEARARKPKQEDSLAYYPATPAKLQRTDFKKYYRACESFYQTYLQRSGFSGGMLVARSGQIVYEKYAGFERLDRRDSITRHSPLHLASISKTFTGMAVLKLWEEGKLDIHAGVATYLEGFPYEKVTVKSLLNHRSGLPNYVHVMEQMGWNKKKIVYNADVLDFLIQNYPRLRGGAADRGFSYCNTNYALLALIVEKVSGLPFPQYMQEQFFGPMGMQDTYVFTMSDSLRSLPSFNYRNQQEAFTFLDAVYGDKNIYCTPRDLLRWDSTLNSGTFFKKATLDSAYKGYSFERPGVKNYGLGWRLLLYPNQRKIVYHNGWWHGNNTVFARLIDDSTTIIIIGNKYNRNIYQAKKLFTQFGHYGKEEEGDE